MVSTAQETHALSGLGGRPMLERDIAAYHRHFPRRDGSITGEWSPDYLSSPAALGHIQACAPAARFLVILRDPVERYRAGVERWRSAKDRKGKHQNLWAGRRDAFARSFHGFGLRRFVDAFGPDRLLVLQLERCLVDPAAELARTLSFLGLADQPAPADLLEPPEEDVLRDRLASPTPGEPDDLVAMLEPDVLLLHSLVPDLDLSLWPSFRHLAAGSSARRG